jgi:hypothetical protein
MILSQADIELLKQLSAAGERGRTDYDFGAYGALKRLVKRGYVIDQQTGLASVRYRITRSGLDALAEHA